jgi:hypothetical protein
MDTEGMRMVVCSQAQGRVPSSLSSFSQKVVTSMLGYSSDTKGTEISNNGSLVKKSGFT